MQPRIFPSKSLIAGSSFPRAGLLGCSVYDSLCSSLVMGARVESRPQDRGRRPSCSPQGSLGQARESKVERRPQESLPFFCSPFDFLCSPALLRRSRNPLLLYSRRANRRLHARARWRVFRAKRARVSRLRVARLTPNVLRRMPCRSETCGHAPGRGRETRAQRPPTHALQIGDLRSDSDHFCRYSHTKPVRSSFMKSLRRL
jgi:hypothetical protein